MGKSTSRRWPVARGKIIGLHMIRVYLEEKKGNIDYLG